jgi:hypothetical protein
LLGKQTNDASKYKQAFKSKQMQASEQHTSNFGSKTKKAFTKCHYEIKWAGGKSIKAKDPLLFD